METVIPFDWQRMLWGDLPPLFLLEIVFRVIVIWGWTAMLLRWIGGRSISQLSMAEFLLVIALGSAVGDSLFYPEVPLVHAMLVILVIVLLDKAVDWAIRRWPRAKRVFDGQPVEVLREGRILHDGVAARQMGATELMELLRLKGISNLGAVQGAWLEASGSLSVLPADPPRRGLQIMPPVEGADLPPPDDAACCTDCGRVVAVAPQVCGDCSGTRWTRPEQAVPPHG